MKVYKNVLNEVRANNQPKRLTLMKNADVKSFWNSRETVCKHLQSRESTSIIIIRIDAVTIQSTKTFLWMLSSYDFH